MVRSLFVLLFLCTLAFGSLFQTPSFTIGHFETGRGLILSTYYSACSLKPGSATREYNPLDAIAFAEQFILVSENVGSELWNDCQVEKEGSLPTGFRNNSKLFALSVTGEITSWDGTNSPFILATDKSAIALASKHTGPNPGLYVLQADSSIYFLPLADVDSYTPGTVLPSIPFPASLQSNDVIRYVPDDVYATGDFLYVKYENLGVVRHNVSATPSSELIISWNWILQNCWFTNTHSILVEEADQTLYFLCASRQKAFRDYWNIYKFDLNSDFPFTNTSSIVPTLIYNATESNATIKDFTFGLAGGELWLLYQKSYVAGQLPGGLIHVLRPKDNGQYEISETFRLPFAKYASCLTVGNPIFDPSYQALADSVKCAPGRFGIDCSCAGEMPILGADPPPEAGEFFCAGGSIWVDLCKTSCSEDSTTAGLNLTVSTKIFAFGNNSCACLNKPILFTLENLPKNNSTVQLVNSAGGSCQLAANIKIASFEDECFDVSNSTQNTGNGVSVLFTVEETQKCKVNTPLIAGLAVLGIISLSLLVVAIAFKIKRDWLCKPKEIRKAQAADWENELEQVGDNGGDEGGEAEGEAEA
eukprot:TRINITY_DN153_c0_g1_i1.p1 TRINITY_DN153_c0_g1~~TRINITY_DN153_c0_g1_i1.p1  ORF type:complete len:606 (+),score=10.26 TRINITY_DN153_c0_g1_i1:54-1820(+)